MIKSSTNIRLKPIKASKNSAKPIGICIFLAFYLVSSEKSSTFAQKSEDMKKNYQLPAMQVLEMKKKNVIATSDRTAASATIYEWGDGGTTNANIFF